MILTKVNVAWVVVAVVALISVINNIWLILLIWHRLMSPTITVVVLAALVVLNLWWHGYGSHGGSVDTGSAHVTNNIDGDWCKQAAT